MPRATAPLAANLVAAFRPGAGKAPSMNCPVDGTLLVLAERQGIEIDYCPVCRGVWLDRGEVDKLIDRAAGRQGTDHVRAGQSSNSDDDDDDRSRRTGSPPTRKRKSFLGNVFDFGS